MTNTLHTCQHLQHEMVQIQGQAIYKNIKELDVFTKDHSMSHFIVKMIIHNIAQYFSTSYSRSVSRDVVQCPEWICKLIEIYDVHIANVIPTRVVVAILSWLSCILNHNLI